MEYSYFCREGESETFRVLDPIIYVKVAVATSPMMIESTMCNKDMFYRFL
jgi:hypothetical protein